MSESEDSDVVVEEEQNEQSDDEHSEALGPQHRFPGVTRSLERNTQRAYDSAVKEYNVRSLLHQSACFLKFHSDGSTSGILRCSQC